MLYFTKAKIKNKSMDLYNILKLLMIISSQVSFQEWLESDRLAVGDPFLWLE